ncbi:alternative splicing regulator-domain-containing protein [Gigaspora margarita]|uniref:Alternative splicing regulator-domain-containing protein n=1 Tax=Gigaspora margarita TaxID=4874 RepID=A0A8H3X8M7_GIGMA|nr:alternative splicing regulator-domain-containing protein [Gigaspora margarita]
MQWQGDAETRIDRFDGRALLDYLPPDIPNLSILPTDERDLQEELNFERFRDLVENERRNVTEDSCLEEIEAEWTSLLERHKAMIKKLQEKSDTNNQGFGYDYGTEKQDEIPSDEESHHLDEEDILDYVDDLTDKDRQTLNIMGKKYQIPDYTRLLRIAKRDREEKAQEFKESQKIKERKSRRHMSRKEDHSERIHMLNRDSPTYEPYTDSDSSTSLSEEQEVGNFVIEFGNSEENASESSSSRSHKEELSLAPLQRGSLSHTRKNETLSSQKANVISTSSHTNTNNKVPPKKLTPAEKLRLKLQMGLNKQIQVDEKKKIQKEREQKFERLGSEEIEKHLIKSASKRLKRSISRERSRKTSAKSKSSRTRYRRDHSSSVDTIRTSKRRRHRSRSTSFTSSSSRSRSRSRSRFRSRSRSRSRFRSRSRSRTRSRSRSRSRSPYRRRTSSYSSGSDYSRRSRSSRSRKRRTKSRTRSSSSSSESSTSSYE